MALTGFVKDLDALARQFLWASNFSGSKWSLVKWEIVCSLKQLGGLCLRWATLSEQALAVNLYWRWCVEWDQVWARILAHKYLPGVSKEDIPRYPMIGKGSMIWNTLRKGASLVKEGLLWICKRGKEALFLSDSWDGFPSIISQYPNLTNLCRYFQKAGWSRVSDFKSYYQDG